MVADAHDGTLPLTFVRRNEDEPPSRASALERREGDFDGWNGEPGAAPMCGTGLHATAGSHTPLDG